MYLRPQQHGLWSLLARQVRQTVDLYAPTHRQPVLCMTAGLSQEDLVTMLRSQARKSTVRTSSYRGVSLLKQTGKWHAQINIGGKQVLM